MLTEVHQISFGSGRCRAMPYAVPQDRAGGDLSNVDQDWPAVMARVRDERDRAAFGTLFGHFAPRVK